MDVFKLRDGVVNEYSDYVKSFIRVRDPKVDSFVQQEMEQGELWPEAVLQLNPAFQPADPDRTLRELAAAGQITPDTARFFGEDIRLYRHQAEALQAAQRDEPYVVTTGTGSGKSLTYLVPIYDAIMRDHPERPGVRAIIVYPMNALINSQLDALGEYQDGFPGSQVRVARLTGQDRGEARERIFQNPPHILLTNYVMLEYLLIRPSDRSLLSTATRDLQFLVMDELHFYRGRQGADVGMLLRRVQQKAGHSLQMIGTSATLATGGTRDEQRATIAEVASRMFGVTVPPANVIDETLRRVTDVPEPDGRDELRAAVQAPPPVADLHSVTTHPLSAWAEHAFGVARDGDRLVRREPETFQNVVDRLVEGTGLSDALCYERLRATLEAGNKVRLTSGQPVFAFRLHQFLSSGSSVYSTLEPNDSRYLTMEGQYKADDERVLFPLAFCRECGQDYYLVSLVNDHGAEKLVPRSPMAGTAEDDLYARDGFFAIDHGSGDDELWRGDLSELPDFWFDQLKRGPRLKSTYAEDVPAEYSAAKDGSLSMPGTGGVRGWFQPRPLMLCLRCRAVYDRRDGDYRKLSSLSQTGRSTATTILVNATVAGMAKEGLPREESKALSFTDNRQDASLQAGHLNDFVQVAQLRSAIVEAATRNKNLSFDVLGQAVFEALDLRPEDFLREPVDGGPGYEAGRRAMVDLLEYRALEDLSRGWRIVQPNLEQVGLLRIGYEGLRELADDDGLWRGLHGIGEVVADERERVLRAVLDHLRMQLAIDAGALTEANTSRLTRSVSQWLRDPWSLDEREVLKTQNLALLPGVEKGPHERRVISLGSRSSLARYLRDGRTWGMSGRLDASDAEAIVRAMVVALRGHILAVVTGNGGERGVRVLAAALRWEEGDGESPPPDPVRARALHLRREVEERRPNSYFTSLYRERARHLRGMLGAEHTGQVSADRRQDREEKFRAGSLPALFCSPTMELGVDIRDLHAVHMRNVPPTPANYAQRSGRAGRGGRPALIVAFSAQGNVHDQHFFRNRNKMIAGAVAPARMDLCNRELVQAHLHSTWLAITGLSLGGKMFEILDLDDPAFPILGDALAQIQGRNSDRFEQETLEAAQGIINRVSDVAESWWFNEDWLRDVVRNAPAAFDAAFDRWRELYRSALKMREAARKQADSFRLGKQERDEAKRQERAAEREIELLLNATGRNEESDFYPYRYLASEGFLPGYNFPRLPIRALVTVQDASQSIDRFRFLGLTEFGPGNVIYHEGGKHRVEGITLPPDGVEARLTRARLCNACGYAHDGDAADVDLCEHCGTRLDASTSTMPQRLLDQPTVRTRQVERISSDEEERRRSGYETTTHYRFAPGGQPRQASVKGPDGTVLLDVVYAPSATVWKINHGWRRGDGNGFLIDPQTGRWARRDMDAGPGEGDDPSIKVPITGVKPYVTDSRNVLLLKPCGGEPSEEFMTTLLYALKRGVELVHQVEDQEVAAELIGQDENRRLMFWDAAEGGTGVWDRIVEESDGFAEVAREALRVCHFDPETGEEDPDHDPTDCAASCYECLLTYSNQPQHRYLDRNAVREFLLGLAGGVTASVTQGRERKEQYEWLNGLVDPTSPAEERFLRFLYEGGFRLPDAAQNRPADGVPSQLDFYYAQDGVPGVCLFVDGRSHDGSRRQEKDAAARGLLMTVVTA